jgi:hypothetical protein
MDDPKILLCSPINIVKEYCLYEWLDHIKQLSFPVEIFLVDNSLNPAFSQKIRDLGYNCEHEPPAGRAARYFIASSLERCREKFLSGDYTHFFSLECDIFPPLDVIEKLLLHDKDIVGSTYWYFSGYDSQLQLFTMYNFHTDDVKRTQDYRTRRLSFSEAQLFMDGTCKPIYANGIGCTLIKRWLLEEFKFRVDPLDAGYPDSFFHTDLWRAGIDNYVDTSFIPTHKNSNWNAILSDTGHKKMQGRRGDIKLNKI